MTTDNMDTNMEVIEEEKELVVDTKTTSVFEITKDLLEDGDHEEQLGAPSSQIDWNWGGDGFGDGDENENNNDDGSVDSDATEEIESDNEEEAEKDSSNDCENSGAEKGNDGEMKMDGNDDDVANAATESSSSASSSPKKEEQKKGADLQGVLDAEDSEGEEEELDILSSKDNDDVDNDSDAEDDDENSEDNSKDKPSSKDNTDDVSLDDDDSDDEASVGNALLDAADKALNDEEYDESLLLETQPPSPSIVKEGKAATTSDAAEDGNEDEDKNDSNETTMEVDDKEEQEEAEEPVLSQEEPEDTAAGDQEDEDSSTEELVVDKQEKKKGKKKKKSKSKQPDLDDLLRSTDYLYQHADQSEVTVKDIKQSLEAEYDCKLSKANSKKVREHLKDLINKKILASIAGDQEEESEPEPEEESEPEPEDKDDSDFEVEKPKKKNKKEQAGHEDSDAEESVVGQADESDSDDSEFEESLKDKKKKRKQSKPIKGKLTKPKPLGERKAAKAARLIEAERLRKKRMDELRVRNEEMQLNISKEEQERSEKIAARLETNTDELRAKRLEDRLNLLQALDQKRIEVVEIKDKEPREPAASTPKLEQQEEAVAAVENEDSSSDEESSDDEEIEIVGIARPLKPMKPIHTHFKSKALDILQKLRSPEVKKARKVSVSPGTSSMNARMALRQKLKEKQRTAGNRWLARELGYKTEKEHLKDCQTVINQKREQVVKFEQLRLKANERTQLRQRMLLGEEMPPNQEDDDGEEEYKPDEAENEEENEELRIARELEEERNGGQKSPEPSTVTPVANEKTTIGTSDDADMTNAEETQEAAANRKDDTLSESQPLETQPPLNATVLPASLTMQVSAEGSNFVTDETETEEPADGNQDASLETQTLETQPLPDIPEKERVAPRIVSEESDDASPESLQGNGGTLSGNATEPESAETSPSPSQPEGEDDDAEGELEFVDDTPPEVTAEREEAKASAEPKKPRNAGWQAMLQREAEKLRKQKKRKNAGGLFEEEAEEEEEEEVAGLEDFGFSVKKKDKDGDEEDNANLELDEDDLKHVVDDVSDDEGDEDAGRKARQRQQEREEKERHKEMLRRMREGYDGRRGGIAGGAGARGLHRFDQLVAADNREDAKRLGLLNDDELDSDNEEEKSGDKDEEEDETALLDKMLKDRFLHRSDVDVEENFDSDDEEENPAAETVKGNQSDEEEERTQERLAKRFTKRARMQRMEEIYAESQEFSQQRMIDEDESMKLELQSMKNGLLRKRSISSSRSSFSEHGTSSNLPFKRQRSTASNSSFFGGSVTDKSSGSLSIALRASRQIKRRTSFLGGAKAGASGAENNKDGSFAALNRVGLFNSRSSFSNSAFSKGGSSVDETGNKRKERPGAATSTSLFGKVVGRQ